MAQRKYPIHIITCTSGGNRRRHHCCLCLTAPPTFSPLPIGHLSTSCLLKVIIRCVYKTRSGLFFSVLATRFEGEVVVLSVSKGDQLGGWAAGNHFLLGCLNKLQLLRMDKRGLERWAWTGVNTKATCLVKVQDVPKQGGPGLTWQLQEMHLSSVRRNCLLHGNGTDRVWPPVSLSLMTLWVRKDSQLHSLSHKKLRLRELRGHSRSHGKGNKVHPESGSNLHLWRVLISSQCPPGLPPSPPIVDTAQGRVLGKYVSLKGFAQPVGVFLGIPFAKPPLGSLRFAPPQPAEPWTFVKNTTSYSPM